MASLAPSPEGSVLPEELRQLLDGLELADASELFSLSTWEHKLTASDRAQLAALLPSPPPAEPLVRELFSAAPLHFGAPLARFWTAMRAGELSAEAVGREAQQDAAFRQAWLEERRQHHNAMVHRLHYLQRTYSPPPPAAPPLRSGKSGASHGCESLMYSKEKGGLLRMKGVPGRKGGLDDGAISPGEPKKARGGTSVSSKAGSHSAKGAKPSQPEAAPHAYGEAMEEWQGGSEEESMGELSSLEDGEHDELGEEPAQLAAAGEHAHPAPAQSVPLAAMQAPRGGVEHAGFFPLVRDVITSVPHALVPADYVRQQVHVLAESLGMGSRLPPGAALAIFVHSVLHFVASPGGPVALDEATQAYRWVAPPQLSTNEMLARLEAMHYERFVAQQQGRAA
ncbi:hypothetical protein AB1Y20_005898 [Prymnesium parvum]|uniref:DEUBAD domain-containing protein n=1 Tax=Prymnesium parvum TaxID=97485 RepID=A0AB34J330_PRYPA